MQSQRTHAVRVRPKLARTAKRLLKAERKTWTVDAKDKRSINHDSAREHLEKINQLIGQVERGVPIWLDFHMTLHDRISSLELGRPVGTVADYMKAVIRYRLSQVSEDGDEFQDWRYISDLALLAADIEAVTSV